MTASTDLSPLFQPITINGCTLPNRFVMSPMTRGFVQNGVVDEKAISYYRRRAEGGVGLIVTEGIAPSRDGALADYAPDLLSDASQQVWRRVVSSVHEAGGRIMAQLWHAGLMRGMQGEVSSDGRTLGPSDTYPLLRPGEADQILNRGMPMTDADIADTIADCVRFAEVARRLGFDGVEIHGAHGYLFDQFFWTEVNKRADAYNGDIAQRCRFTCETVAAMRRATGPDFPIGIRISQWKSEHYDVKMLATPRDLEHFVGPLVAAGIDFFDCSTRRYWEDGFDGESGTFAQWTRTVSGKPTITVGSVGVNAPMNAHNIGEPAEVTVNVDDIAARIAAGQFDMVAIGRALIANPDYVDIVRAQAFDRLKPYDQRMLDELV